MQSADLSILEEEGLVAYFHITYILRPYLRYQLKYITSYEGTA